MLSKPQTLAAKVSKPAADARRTEQRQLPQPLELRQLKQVGGGGGLPKGGW
jgi:hypothetical protein